MYSSVTYDTFWAWLGLIVVCAVIAGVIFYKRLKNVEGELNVHKQVLNKIAEAVDNEFANIRSEMHRGNADVLGTIADAIEEIEKGLDKGAKKNTK